MPTKTRVIVNPKSGHGATGRRWSEIEPLLTATLGEFEVQRTLGRRDAERIAVEAVQDGAQRIVVAGGDGTTSEVTSGLLEAGLADEVQIGLLPLGTGRDLPRTLGIPSDLPRAIESLGTGSTRQIDAMRITYRDAGGSECTKYSINVTSFGLSGVTVDRVADAMGPLASLPLAGSFAFLSGAIGAIARHRSKEISIRADGAVACEGRFVLAAVANGRYFGGGMHIAPDAAPDDGSLELVIVRELSKARLIASLPSLYRGTHVSNPAVSVQRVTRVEATAPPGAPGPIQIDVDGEGLGTLPLSVEVVPRAVTLFGVGS